MAKEPRRRTGAEPEESGDGGYNAGMAVFSYIIGGILVWSLIGWGLDSLWGTHWLVLAGALLGASGGFYLAQKHGFFKHQAENPGKPRKPSE
ncbi:MULTISPECIES: AtpZ/AtpI family protein [Arthrobacter]|uniref:AtpZ/AtpI family protein n=2 Tax=Arthrobacter TaxID=1663 RepID=A0ABU9KNF6_9MICC|nr:AtpZ/AtpI family protein [Arthrobacter sp. YJM1]MDP5228392.1 AtpZ/AtpI family protein [Arthrobacter sp. YJM1]